MNILDKQVITRSFDRSARHYEKHAVLQQTVGKRLMERLDFVKIKPAWIVDVGAGTGMTARALEKKYKFTHVLQADLSVSMLRQARKRKKKLFSRQHYVCTDAESMPLGNATVDLVFSSLTYQWCNDLDRVFSEASRVLTKNGLHIFASLGPDTLKELRASWLAVDEKMHVNNFIDMHDVGDALVRAGLQGIVMDVEIITLEYTDCGSLMHELKLIGAQNANVKRQNTLTGKDRMKRMITAYEQYRRNGTLPATYEIVYGLGWKPAGDQPTRHSGISYIPVEKIKKRKNEY